jgi:hypothetical protein
MATVYLAWDEKLRRQVVIKVMLSFQAADENFQARFQQEALATAKLSHPNIVHVYDLGQQADLSYMVMEFMPGGSLHDLIGAKGRADPAQAVSIIGQIASALDYAHQNGIIHRDVKPANILFAKDGRAVLTDLGIARAMEGPRLTRAMSAIGTPEYMSPEQGRGDPIDGRSDLYSLGVVLYELLSGVLPYQADTPWGIIFKHMSEPLPPIQKANSNLSLALRSVVEKMLAKRPDDRFQTGRELTDALHLALKTPGKRLFPPPPTPITTPDPYLPTSAPETTSDAKTRLIVNGCAAPPAAPPAGADRRRGGAWRWLLTAGLVIVIAAGIAVPRLRAGKEQPAVVAAETPRPGSTGVTEQTAATVTLVPTRASAAGPTLQRSDETIQMTAMASRRSTETPRAATATVIPSATPAPPTATSLPPIVTPAPAPTRPAATATRPPPTAAQLTPTPAPRQTTSVALPAPVLISPAAGENATGQTNFTWSWAGSALGTDLGFEVRIWKEGRPVHYGAAEPTNDTSLTINLPAAFGVAQGGSGAYFWTVAVVQRRPYQQVGPEAPPRSLQVQVSGGDGGGRGGPAPTWAPPPP